MLKLLSVAPCHPLHKSEALPLHVLERAVLSFRPGCWGLSKLPGGLGQHEELREEKRNTQMALRLGWHPLTLSCGALTASGCPSSGSGVVQGARRDCHNPGELGLAANTAPFLSRRALACLVLYPHLTQTLSSHFPKPAAAKILLEASRLGALQVVCNTRLAKPEGPGVAGTSQGPRAGLGVRADGVGQAAPSMGLTMAPRG